MRYQNSLRHYLLPLMAFCTLLGVAGTAKAGLMIMPVYAVFQDRERSSDITILNTDESDVTYRLSWIYQKQNEDASYTLSDTPINPAMDFDKSVFFSPRQVTLPPSGKQNIRLSVRRPADLPEGEYHAHLKIQSMGSPQGMSIEGPTNKDGVSMALSVNPGFGVPVIVRSGKYNATAKISDPMFIAATKEGEMPKIQFFLNRSGTHGTMGKVNVYWTPAGGQEQEIGLLNNVNIFTEIERRMVRVTLKEKSIPGGTIRVVYEGVGPDKGITFDEKSFPIGG